MGGCLKKAAASKPTTPSKKRAADLAGARPAGLERAGPDAVSAQVAEQQPLALGVLSRRNLGLREHASRLRVDVRVEVGPLEALHDDVDGGGHLDVERALPRDRPR